MIPTVCRHILRRLGIRHLRHAIRYALVGRTPHIVAACIGVGCGAIPIGAVIVHHRLHDGVVVVAPGVPTDVPEPGALLVFGVGVVGLVAARRARNG